MMQDLISLPIPIEKTNLDSRFRLVILASDRARRLMTLSKPVIETSYRKPSTIAIQEILEARVEYLTGKEARKELRRASEVQALEEAKSLADRAKEEEVKSEIEKDLAVYLSESEAVEKKGTEGE